MWEVRPLDEVADQLRREFPDCGEIEPLQVLGQGFSSLAVVTANGYVFLIARNGEPKYASAITFLKDAGKWLPQTVPDPQFAKSHILGYRKLAGQSLESGLDGIDLESLADDVARFMVVLHSMKAPDNLSVVMWDDYRKVYQQRRTDTANIIRERMTTREADIIEAWWDRFLTDDRMSNYRPVVVHGDLWYGNMLVDANGRLSAVVDWEGVCVSDPALDFVPQIYPGEAFDARVLAVYEQSGGQLDPYLAYRVEQLRIVREFSGLQMALQWDDAEEINESIDKIRATKLFVD